MYLYFYLCTNISLLIYSFVSICLFHVCISAHNECMYLYTRMYVSVFAFHVSVCPINLQQGRQKLYSENKDSHFKTTTGSLRASRSGRRCRGHYHNPRNINNRCLTQRSLASRPHSRRSRPRNTARSNRQAASIEHAFCLTLWLTGPGSLLVFFAFSSESFFVLGFFFLNQVSSAHL